MTTDAETNQQTEYTNTVELSCAIGRLEGVVEALVEGPRQFKQDLNEGLRETNRRIDRLQYTTIGFGTALIVAVVASNVFGG